MRDNNNEPSVFCHVMMQPLHGQSGPIAQVSPSPRNFNTMIMLFLGFFLMVFAIFSQWHGTHYDMPTFEEYDLDKDELHSEAEGKLFSEATTEANEWKANWQSNYSLLHPIGLLTFGMGLLFLVLGPQGANMDKWVRAVFMAGVMWFLVRLLTVDYSLEEVISLISLAQMN